MAENYGDYQAGLLGAQRLIMHVDTVAGNVIQSAIPTVRHSELLKTKPSSAMSTSVPQVANEFCVLL
ncbi:hypothetical protein RU639_009316 [Aspergillus parasiticus]